MKLLLPVLFFLFALQSAFAGRLIVGGEEVGPADPVRASTVGIFTPARDGRSGSLCTGTLIGRGVALTAAHCLPRGARKPMVLFGPDLHAPNLARREASRVLVHPRWRKRAGRGMDQGDIALVRFPGALPAGYRAARLAGSDREIRRGAGVLLAGYGIANARTHEGAGRLRRAALTILDPRSGRTEMILDQSRGRGACHGDSGGPAFLNRKGGLVLAGVTNRGYPEGAPDDCAHGAVYTKVPSYRRWILGNKRRLATAPSRLATARLTSK